MVTSKDVFKREIARQKSSDSSIVSPMCVCVSPAPAFAAEELFMLQSHN